MNKFLGIFALLIALALPVFGQWQQSRMSPDDQKEFDKQYKNWVDDTRKNDRDDIRKDEQKMQDIMRRYNIPPDVPYDRVASGYNQGYSNERGYYGNRYDQSQARLSPGDQQEFDKAYSKWQKDMRSDRDDVPKDERKMRDIMSRYNIPPDVPFDAIASQGRRY